MKCRGSGTYHLAERQDAEATIQFVLKLKQTTCCDARQQVRTTPNGPHVSRCHLTCFNSQIILTGFMYSMLHWYSLYLRLQIRICGRDDGFFNCPSSVFLCDSSSPIRHIVCTWLDFERWTPPLIVKRRGTSKVNPEFSRYATGAQKSKTQIRNLSKLVAGAKRFDFR